MVYDYNNNSIQLNNCMVKELLDNTIDSRAKSMII